MKYYLRVLSICYAIGALLHVLDLAGLRLDFSNLSLAWQIWVVSLAIADTVAAIGLWRARNFGVVAFLLVSLGQLIVYGVFSDFSGEQSFLIGFHTLTLFVFAGLFVRERKLRAAQRG